MFPPRSPALRAQVRFFALRRIEPHAPPLVRAPVNSFEFQPCDRTPQADCLSVSCGTAGLGTCYTKQSSFRARTTRVSNPVCCLAFAPQRQLWSSAPLSPQVFLPISTHFTATPGIPRTSPTLQHHSFACRPRVKPGDFTSDLWHRLRALYAQ